MSINTINAIKVSHMEEELKEVKRKIKYYTVALNSSTSYYKNKSVAEKMLKTLIAKEVQLENSITEHMLLK